MIGRFHVEGAWAAAVLAASIGCWIRKLGRLVAIKVPLPNKLESDDDISALLRSTFRRHAATSQHLSGP